MTDQENGLVSVFSKTWSKPVVTFEEVVMKNNDTFMDPVLNLTPCVAKNAYYTFQTKKISHFLIFDSYKSHFFISSELCQFKLSLVS